MKLKKVKYSENETVWREDSNLCCGFETKLLVLEEKSERKCEVCLCVFV